MKATISELYNTGREIISFDNSEFDRPSTLSDLKGCNNVIVDKRDKDTGLTPVLIDNRLCYCRNAKYNGRFGSFNFVEVEF